MSCLVLVGCDLWVGVQGMEVQAHGQGSWGPSRHMEQSGRGRARWVMSALMPGPDRAWHRGGVEGVESNKARKGHLGQQGLQAGPVLRAGCWGREVSAVPGGVGLSSPWWATAPMLRGVVDISKGTAEQCGIQSRLSWRALLRSSERPTCGGAV